MKKLIIRNSLLILTVLVLAIINTALSTLPVVTFIKWVKIFEVSALAIYIWMLDEKIKRFIIPTLYYSTIFFSMVGIGQFILGKTLGGALYLFGERSFDTTTPGIALTAINGIDYLRAYSTFPHPNALAGFLGASILLTASFWKIRARRLIGLVVPVVCLMLTFSLAAIIGVVVCVLLWLIHIANRNAGRIIKQLFALGILTSLLLPVYSKELGTTLNVYGETVSQRLQLSLVAGKMVSERFLAGEGLNTFVINVTRFVGFNTYSWTLQPVHNIFLLVFSETGVLGLLLLCLYFYKLLNILPAKNIYFSLAVTFVIVTGLIDHYWLTAQQNLLLIGLLTGLIISSGNVSLAIPKWNGKLKR